MDSQDDEILQSFIDESREHLADIENNLLTIEERGADIDEDLVNRVFRAAHSIKGGAGFMGLEMIKNLAHKIENVLGMIRSREITPNSEVVNILLGSFDKLRDMINHVGTSNEEDISEYTVALAGITSAYLPQEEKKQVTETVQISLPNGQPLFAVSRFDVTHAIKNRKVALVLEFDMIHDIHRRGMTPLQFLKRLQEQGTLIDCTVETSLVGTLDDRVIINRLPLFVLMACDVSPDEAADVFGIGRENVYTLGEDLVVKPVAMGAYEVLTPPRLDPVPPAPRTAAAPSAAQAAETRSSSTPPAVQSPAEGASPEEPSAKADEPVKETETSPAPSPAKAGKTDARPAAGGAETSLRVNVKLLDSLMNLAGELVLSRNELVQASALAQQNLVASATQRINLVTSELQEAIMLTRMQPVGNIFNKFPRVVRDLAVKLGKKIELSVSGKDVELDKTIIEGLADPLTHLVRNSADHGIEDPAVRRKAGKGETGQIWLKAYHEAGQVNIEVTDDGRGIDPEKVAEAAIQKGFISPKQAQTMSDKEKIALIFLPGFSLAQKVTDVSGRGVGMDVVKTNLDRLGGQIDIESRNRKGTTIRIKLPLTLAIIPSLMISCRGQRYALPMVNVVELLRIPADQVKDRIEKVGDAEVVRLRQELLPVLSLKKLLESSEPKEGTGPASVASRAMNIVVVSAGPFKYGLIVDELHDSEEIVVKPLDQHLKKIRGYAGATIMGNGQVALILDVPSLAHIANLNVEETLAAKAAVEVGADAASRAEKTRSLLIFGSSEQEKFGVPVDLVHRIERITARDIERIGGKKTIKYRGGILPVYALDEVAHVGPLTEREELLVVVFNLDGHEFGLLAVSPIDTVDVVVDLDTETLRQPGIRGSAIINSQTTLIVDIYEFIGTINPAWAQPVLPEVTDAPRSTKILYAEDSGFFRSTVKGFLEEQGYNVLDAQDGADAWRILEENADTISMVLTDIEMPNLDGIGLSKKIKSDKRFQHIPIVALTTLASDRDMERGKAAGVTEYQIKLDKEHLLAAVQQFAGQR
jgi:two-component system, chemotaxis family, sensor kinase CheA